MKKIISLLSAMSFMSAIAILTTPAQAAPPTVSTSTTSLTHVKPPRILHTANRNPAIATPSTTFSYRGGPVMTRPIHLYVIWYGNWPNLSRKKPVIERLLTNFGQSPYYAIDKAYTQSDGKHVSDSMTVASEFTDSYSSGKSLQDSTVASIVSHDISTQSTLQSSTGSADKDGIYIVITSADVVNTSGFMTTYCGWHTAGQLNGVTTKFIFAGDPSSNMSVCAPETNRQHSPNNYPGVDAVASTLAHEISETVTDPELNAWADDNNMENADLCAWQYGKTYTTASSQANMQFGFRDYLIQENWNVKSHRCSLQ